MLFPLHNSSSFQSNLMPGQFFFWLNTCTKKYRKSRELTVKGKLKDTLGARGISFKVGESRSLLSDLEKKFLWHQG